MLKVVGLKFTMLVLLVFSFAGGGAVKIEKSYFLNGF